MKSFGAQILILLFSFLSSTLRGQSITCYDLETKEIISNYTLRSQMTDELGEAIHSSKISEYANLRVCISAFGYKDTCIVLRSGLNEIYLNLMTSEMEEVEVVAESENIKKMFLSSLQSIQDKNFLKEPKFLRYQFVLNFVSDSSSVCDTWYGNALMRNPALKKSKRYFSIYFENLVIARDLNGKGLGGALDSLDYYSKTVLELNEIFWINRELIELLIKRVSSKNKSDVTCEIINRNVVYSFPVRLKDTTGFETENLFFFEFDERLRLVSYKMIGYDFINPVYLVERSKTELEVYYSENVENVPASFRVKKYLLNNSNFYKEYCFDLVSSSERESLNNANKFPVNTYSSIGLWIIQNEIPFKIISE